MTAKILQQIPQQINNPIAVSKTTKNTFIVLTELKDTKDKPVVVILHINRQQNKYKVNKVASIYGREPVKITKSFNEKYLLYYHKEKIANFLVFHLSRSQRGQLTTMFLNFDKNKSRSAGIITNKDIKSNSLHNNKKSALLKLKQNRDNNTKYRGR